MLLLRLLFRRLPCVLGGLWWLRWRVIWWWSSIGLVLRTVESLLECGFRIGRGG